MEYQIIRSKRKTMSLCVRADLMPEVKAPLHTSKHEIDAFVHAHTEWIVKQQERRKIDNLREASLTPERVKALKQQAKEELFVRVQKHSKALGLYPTSFKITSAKTRFGSCSGKNGICFSYRLMLYPPEAWDYVVVHELAHIKYKNHSKAFYAFIENYMPDYRARESLLKN